MSKTVSNQDNPSLTFIFPFYLINVLADSVLSRMHKNQRLRYTSTKVPAQLPTTPGKGAGVIPKTCLWQEAVTSILFLWSF